MKKILCIVIFSISFLYQNSLNAQTIEWGISPSFNISSFDYKDNNGINNLIISPVNSYNPGLMAFVGLNTSSAFQFRLLTHLNFKRIQFNTLLDGSVDGSISYEFMGYDVGLLARYKLSAKKWQVAPALGFFLSYNDYFGWTVRGNSSNGGFNTNPWTLNDYTNPLPLSAGVLGTLEIIPPFSMNGRFISFQASGWYSLRDFFDEPLELTSTNETIAATGRYHQLSLSLNIYFNRMKE